MKKTIILTMILAMVVTLVPANLNAASVQEIKDVSVREAYTGATITWDTRKKSNTEFRYYENLNNETLVTEDRLTRDHRVILHALDPGVTYQYEIVAGSERKQGSFKTLGERAKLTVYQPYFTLLFDDYWRNINGRNPSRINDLDALYFNRDGFTGKALTVNRDTGYLQYSCDNNTFNAGFGTVSAWVSFDRFDKSAVIWQTNDSRYALYYEVGDKNADFDKRIVARAGGNIDGEYPEAEYVLDTKGSSVNKWGTNEWHFVTMTWEGKFKGDVKLYIDGRRVDEAEYEDASGCSTFRIGNNYRDDNMFFSIGKIDELKLHQWAMHQYYVNSNYQAYNYSSNFERKGSYIGGTSVRYFKNGKLLKAPDNKIYVISNRKRIYVDNMTALNRLKPVRLINATWDEINQYEDSDTFHSWSRFPQGSLLKAYGQSAVYWNDGYELHLIPNETVFNKYGNEWIDVIEISQSELSVYKVGADSK